MQKLKLLFYFIGLFLLFRFIFIFRQITCVAENNRLEAEVCQLINANLRGKSLFFTDLEQEAVWDELLANQKFNQLYQFQKIEKSITGQAKLYLTSKLPDYRLVIGEQKYLLNQSNQLKNDQAQLSLLNIEFKDQLDLIQQGYLAENYHQQFLQLSQAIGLHKIPVTKIVWQDDLNIYLDLDPQKTKLRVILDNTGDFAEQMERLAIILNADEAQGLLADQKTLDLRFNLPVLKP